MIKVKLTLGEPISLQGEEANLPTSSCESYSHGISDITKWEQECAH